MIVHVHIYVPGLDTRLVPRLTDLYSVHKKRGGAWYAKSRELRHPIEPYIPMIYTVLLGDEAIYLIRA